MKVVRTTPYLRALRRMRLDEASARRIEDLVVANPAAGDVIRGLSGIRKLRFPLGHRGKSGGGRAIYYVVWDDDTVFMLSAYAKFGQRRPDRCRPPDTAATA